MATRGIGPAVLLCLFAAGATTAEVEDWSDAPGAWTVGLNLSAFCSPGARTFDSRGEFVTVSEGAPAPPGHMTSEDAFFAGYYKGPVHWSPDGPVREELTTFEIRRGAERGLEMEGFVGKALAVSREFETVKLTGWFWARKVDAASCEGDKAPLIQVHYYVDGCCYGKTYLRRARLAVAADEALIVRFDDYSCRLCLTKEHKRIYARFPARRVAESDAVSHTDELTQAPDP